MMVDFGPHRIPHDYKYQSKGDFDPAAKSKGADLLSVDGSTTLVGSSEDIPEPEKSTKSKFPPEHINKDEHVPKVVRIIGRIHNQQSQRRVYWSLLLTLIIILATILVPVLVTKLKHGGNDVAGGLANSTATIVVSQSTTTTKTPNATMVVITQTLQTATVTVSSPSSPMPSSSQSTSPAIPIEGFHAESFENGNLQLFYGDAYGNIRSMQYVQGIWSDPAVVTSDAKRGTTITASMTYYTDSQDYYYHDDSVLWRIFYIDQNNTLQEIRKNITLDEYGDTESGVLSGLASTGWSKGSLGSYHFKTADSLYQRSCAYLQKTTESTADSYLYFDSDTGGIAKIAWWSNTDTWQMNYDLPEVGSSSNKAVECTTNNDGIENLWIVNDSGVIEQWWFDASDTNSNASQSHDWHRGVNYTGSIQPNTSIYGITEDTVVTVFFQAANNSIVQLSISGEASNAAITEITEVGVGAPGKRLDVSGADTVGVNSTDTSVFVYFQNGSHLVQAVMERNNLTGEYLLDTITFIPTVTFGDAAVKGLMPSLVLSFSCFAIVLYLL